MTTLIIVLGMVLSLAAPPAQAALMSSLLGEDWRDERGAQVGSVEDFIVDARSGRVLYLIVDAPGRYYTLPVRALGEDRRVDMSEADEMARRHGDGDARFRRASELLGERVTHPHPGDPQYVGTILDIEFDPASGEVLRVELGTPQGRFGVGPGVLAQGRFPPLRQEQRQYPDQEALGNRDWVRRKPADERRQYHYLRRKLEPALIRNVRGVGYRVVTLE